MGIVKSSGLNMLDGCGKVIQIFLFIFNFLILLFGLALVGLSIWTLYDNNHIDTLLNSNMINTAAGILLTMGIIISILAFLGCCGAARGVKCLLATYFVILLLIFILIAIAAVFGYMVKDEIKNKAEKKMIETLQEYEQKDQQKVTEAWDFAQSKLGCCGVNHFEDWGINNWKFKEGSTFSKEHVPKSCCRDQTSSCQANPVETTTFTTGCLKLVEDFIVNHAIPLAAMAITILVIMVVAMILSCSLFMML